jgi:hypothetical protein
MQDKTWVVLDDEWEDDHDECEVEIEVVIDDDSLEDNI